MTGLQDFLGTISTSELIILFVLTLFNIFFNWYVSLKDRRFHALFRFVGFECIFVLLLLNYPAWFENPFSTTQIISWVLLILSICIAFTGINIYYKKGKPEDMLEETINIVSTGIYKYIRHPMYMSLIVFGFGVMLKEAGLTQVIIGIVNFIAIYLTAKVEEKEMIAKFGDEYRSYIEKTTMFIPYIF